MKFALTAIALGFLVLSCKKESNVSTTGSTSDSTTVNTNSNDTMQTVIPPTAADSTMTTGSTSPAGSDTDTMTTGRTTR